MTNDPTRGGPVDDAAATPPVFLHIGTFKTGTSFTQTVLQRNHDLLAENGVLFPLDDTRWGLQVRAVRDVLGIKHATPSRGAWSDLVGQVHGWKGRSSIISMEFLSLANPERVERIVADLAPNQAGVVLTLRDFVRVLPSAWQSSMKQGRRWPFEAYADSVLGVPDADPDPARRFWAHHDVLGITERWLDVVGVDRFDVVTVPPSGAPPSLLWERFCAVTGLEPGNYDISQDQKSNFSLSYSETELLRQVTLALGSSISRQAHKRWVTRYLANRVMRAPSGADTADDRPRLTAKAYDWAAQQGVETAAGLRKLGVRVTGDLDDLVPAPRSTEPTSTGPGPVQTERVAEVIAALVKRLAQVDPSLPDGRNAGRGGRPRKRNRAEADEAGEDEFPDELDIDDERWA